MRIDPRFKTLGVGRAEEFVEGVSNSFLLDDTYQLQDSDTFEESGNSFNFLYYLFGGHPQTYVEPTDAHFDQRFSTVVGEFHEKVYGASSSLLLSDTHLIEDTDTIEDSNGTESTLQLIFMLLGIEQNLFVEPNEIHIDPRFRLFCGTIMEFIAGISSAFLVDDLYSYSETDQFSDGTQTENFLYYLFGGMPTSFYQFKDGAESI